MYGHAKLQTTADSLNTVMKVYHYSKPNDEPKIALVEARVPTFSSPYSGVCIDMQIKAEGRNIVRRLYHHAKHNDEQKYIIWQGANAYALKPKF